MAVKIKPAVRLIDEDKIGRWEVAAHQTLDAGNLHRPIALRHPMIGLNDANVVDSLGNEFLQRLVNQLDGRDNEKASQSCIADTADHGGSHLGLAAAGGKLQQGATRPTLVGVARVLMIAEA